MSFIEAIRTVLNKYAVFQGRARRAEYWWWALFAALVGIVVQVLLVVAGGPSAASVQISVPGSTVVDWQLAESQQLGAGYWIAFALMVVISLALVLPSLAVTVRRLHDTGRSGWWILFELVPLVGPIVMLVFYLTPGAIGENAYGPDPKAPPSPEAIAL